MKRSPSEKTNNSFLKTVIIFVVSLLFLAIELALYYFAFFYTYRIPWILIGVRIIGFASSLYLYGSRSNINYKLSWTLFILIMPVTGTMIFLFFGNGHDIPKKKYEKIAAYVERNMPQTEIIEGMKNADHVGYKHLQLVHQLTGYPAYKNTQSIFYPDAYPKFQQMLRDIAEAKEFIFLEYFIVGKGYVWDCMRDLLLQKAKEGVDIKFIYDDIGSKTVMPKKDFAMMNKQEHIHIAAYNPMGFNLTPGLNYRDHRKICVIDGRIAYVGGDNLADEYIHAVQRFGFWRDNALRVEGDAVFSFTTLFATNWYMSSKEMIDVYQYKREHNIQNDYIHMPFGDGPANKVDPAYDLITSMIGNAQKYIYISTPYFIIDDAFILRLAQAARSGVDVRILVPHVADKKFVFRMTRAHYRDVLAAGGRIYEYTPGFNHAKNFICDDKYAIVGTINCDYRSLFLHFECGDLFMYDPNILKMKEDFLQALSKSQEVMYEQWKKRSLYQKLVEFFLRAISPLL